jgi:OOP family OmpA-OmpF porin
MKYLLPALLASLATCGAAQAQTVAGQLGSRPYIGVGVSSAQNISSDERSADLKLFGGFDLGRNWGVETGYSHYGSKDFSRSSGGLNLRGTTSGVSAYVAAKYSLPITDKVSVYGKLGLAQSERKYSNSLGMRFKDKDKGVYAALGVEYHINANLSLIAEYEHQGKETMSGAKAEVWTAGVKFGF